MRRSMTPFLWTLFSAGGMVSALLFPVHIFLTGIAYPLDWMAAPSYATLVELAEHPLTRLYLFALISFPLFHWAHRFRYTLHDAFQLKHLGGFIAVVCYGSALVGTVAAARLLWTVP